jgi:hypothetical protein
MCGLRVCYLLTAFPGSRLESFACVNIQTVAFCVKAVCSRERDYQHFGGFPWPLETPGDSHFRHDWHNLNRKGYWKNRPSQQLFKVFIYTYLFRRYMFLPSLAIFRRNTQLFSGSYLATTDPLFLCYRSYFVYGFANTAVVYLICENDNTLKCWDIKI